MCGICGFSGRQDDAILHKMASSIYHRGPDDDGYYADGDVNLGMRRLSIVDLRDGKQPICNEDRTIWVIFNGEIYNHPELRSDLIERGHRFTTDHSDTEVIVHLYEEYGEDWVRHVNGMFGIALWDKPRKSLYLYRDRIGKKPLYYAVKNGQIFFGSEIKALLQHPSISRNLNYQALYEYFALKNTSAPNTAFADIRQVFPGHYLRWQNGSIVNKSYWELDFTPLQVAITEDEAAEEIYRLLKDAVNIRMNCDVPYGAYLSGGVDSSTIVSLMSLQQRQPVITFCLGYEDEASGQFYGKAQDIHHSRMVAERLGTIHHEYIIDANKFADEMPAIIGAFDEPFSGTVSTYFLSTLIKQHVKVAISGDGADELFGSYLSHRLAFPMESYLKLKKSGKIEWDQLDESDRRQLSPFDTKEQFAFLDKIADSNIARWRDQLSVFTCSERRDLLSNDFFHLIGSELSSNRYESICSGLKGGDPLNRVLEIDQKELLLNQILPFVDRLSMAHSIEVRCPFLDHRLVEFVNRLSGKLKIHASINKYILKKTVGRILPKETINRPKEGFVQPVYSWMHGVLKPFFLYHLRNLPQYVFNQKYVGPIIERYKLGDSSYNAKIWNLVCFSIWHQTYVR